MKILYIAPQIPFPPTDGGKISSFGVLKHLAEKGHDIDFVCYLKDCDPERAQKDLSPYCTPHLLPVRTENNLWGALRNLFSCAPYNVSKYISKQLSQFIEDYLEKFTPDVIHVNSLHMGWIVEEIRRYSAAPVLLRQENLEMNIMERYYQEQKNPLLKSFAWMQYRKFIRYEPELCARFDRCVMISAVDENRLKKLNPAIRTAVIPCGVESDLLAGYRPDRSEIKPYSLFHIGSLDWLPNRDGLVWFLREVLPELTARFPDTKLYLYGRDTRIDLDPRVAPHVERVGFVDSIAAAIADKRLAIVPLRIGGGIRIKILELMGMGHNIITTSVGREGIDVEDGNELLIADTREQWVERISGFFQGEYFPEMMAHRARRHIADYYAWDTITGDFERIYSELAG